ncbi:AAA family ATPase [Flavobacterium agrisoli]|uniref:Endonuclease GajA/Old nuclease/RecF-like AAA domain-containing protein n=1 Tax=Flavobacterium agrisoli TaxID=2793066 RepID=A0A934UL58_9FLAO|nr:hypothetical protein [Flavobacterium agrisoli]MBK0371160.1 hypothetical protein [Flavobacterium agrisoli]
MGFKLIAIRPLENCGSKFLKNLNVNRIYKFYENYEFYNSDLRIDNIPENDIYWDINNIKSINNLPENFFSNKINVSAIIGKNGSGKSSIIDLFIASINQISFNLKNRGLLNSTAELISASVDEESKIHCEIFYEIDNFFFIILIDDESFTFKNLNDVIDFDFEKFFYSEVISYSVYAFNSWEIGDWIDNLFHKNDSYQIPIVINPKRESKQDGLAGIIDINNESYLLQQRLLSIVLSDLEFKITDNLSSQYLKLIFKNSKHYFIIDNNLNGREYDDEKDIKDDFYKILNSDFALNFKKNNSTIPSALYRDLNNVLTKFKLRFNIEKINISDVQYKLDIYILYKIISICEKYVSYDKFIVEYPKNNKKKHYTIDIESFLNKIENSQSHIVFKLKQIVNFIKNYELIWSKYIQKELININELSKVLNKKVDKQNTIIELLPPAIFQTKLFSKNKIDLLDRISSGERQLIHSLSTVLYHLTNLNSVENDEILVKFKYVNIILDEIELYFHPEFQKKFIKRLIDEINNIKLRNIKGINILIISHSPFILSDIPKQNVLFLEKGSPVDLEKFKHTNTFGANFSDLLTESFFISEGLIGDYAKHKINDTISWLNVNLEKKRNNIQITHLSVEQEEHKKVIEIIDQPIIKSKLIEMYSEIFGIQERINYLEAEKIRIEEELKKLEAEKM